MTEEMGLREQKKRMTRDAIATAAYELTVSQGIAEVTIDEIARKAFVSPRTVSNYFSSKEEAVLAARLDVTSEIVENFCGDPSATPPLATFRRLMLEYGREHPDELRRAARMASLEADNPTLRPHRVAQEAELVETLQELIASRTGAEADTELYPWLTASAAVAAMMSALGLWSRAGFPEGRLQDLIDEAFDIVESGYASNPARTTSPA